MLCDALQAVQLLLLGADTSSLAIAIKFCVYSCKVVSGVCAQCKSTVTSSGKPGRYM